MIKWYRRGRLILIFRFVFLTLALIAAAFAAGFAIYLSSFLSVFRLTLSVLLFVCVLLFAVRIFSDMKNALSTLTFRIERSLFGKRTMILDSLLEFSRDPMKKRLVLETQHAYAERSAEKSRLFFRREGLKTTLVFLLTFFFTALLLYQFGPVKKRAALLQVFYQSPSVFHLPDYYIQNKALVLKMNNPNFDALLLGISNKMIPFTNGVLTLSTKMTEAKQIHARLIALKWGRRKFLEEKTMRATTRLLPNTVRLVVEYPFGHERYSELQDIEVWRGGKLRLEVNATKRPVKIELTPNVSHGSLLNGRNAVISWIARKSAAYTFAIYSGDKDSYHSPVFHVRVKANQRPGLKLLFPRADVTLLSVNWRVLSLLEAEDDQGVEELRLHVLVTNSDSSLAFSTRKIMTQKLPGRRFERINSMISARDIEMLPGDVASLSFRVYDLFGRASKAVTLNIRAPNFWEIEALRQKKIQKLSENLAVLSNKIGKIQEDAKNNNQSGMDQKSREVESLMDKNQSLRNDIEKSLSRTGEENLREIKETLQKMKEISEALNKKKKWLKNLSKLINQPRQKAAVPKNFKEMQKLLEQYQAMLKNLEYYKKLAESAEKFEALKRIYKSLKEKNNKYAFKRRLKAYRKTLNAMRKNDNKGIRKSIKELQKESSKLEMGRRQSFEKSDKLMQKLQEQLQKQLRNAGKNRMKKRAEAIHRLTEELYLNILVQNDSLKIDPGKPGRYDNKKLARLTENVNSIDSSLRHVRADFSKATEGLMLAEDARKFITEEWHQLAMLNDYLKKSLRDSQLSGVRRALILGEAHVSRIFLLMMQMESELKKAVKRSGQNSPQSGVPMLSLEQLQQMQSGISQALSEMLKKGGKLSPDIKKMMDQLAKLQSEIQKNLSQMMRGENGGLVSGGEEMRKGMEDIIKDLKSYKINGETLEKSKKLEKKMLQSKKALKSKGLNKKRSSESAKYYDVRPPKALQNETLKKNLSEKLPKGLNDYYRALIEKYKHNWEPEKRKSIEK